MNDFQNTLITNLKNGKLIEYFSNNFYQTAELDSDNIVIINSGQDCTPLIDFINTDVKTFTETKLSK